VYGEGKIVGILDEVIGNLIPDKKEKKYGAKRKICFI